MRKPYIAIRLDKLDSLMVYNLINSPRFRSAEDEYFRVHNLMEQSDRNEERLNRNIAVNTAIQIMEGY